MSKRSGQVCMVSVAVILAVALVVTQVEAQMKPDELSLMTTPVLLFDGSSQVSLGTGFFFASTDTSGKLQVPFLVTNYHVLTGYAPGEKGPRKGDRIRFFLHRDPEKPESVKAIDFPIYTKSGDPAWLVSSKDPSADVALLPIPSVAFNDTKVTVFAEKDTSSNMRLSPMSTVTLVGYPHGYFDTTNFLPIWKTGSIASEPLYDFGGKRLFVVDVSAFPGMSGSPVMAIANGTYPAKTGGTVVGDARQLLGVFASIQVLQEKKFIEEIAVDQGPRAGIMFSTSLDLGHVWRAEIILEIIKEFDSAAWESKVLRNLP